MSEIDWSKAPEGATHFDPNDDVGLPWMRLQQGRWRAFDEEYQCWTAPMDEDDSFIRNNDGAQCIPRPTQWRGPEDGLPPVGEPCEVCFNDTVHECRGLFSPAKVIAYHEDMVWLDLGVLQPVRILSECSFRPLKSDKERAVEAALKVMPYPGSPSTRADLERAYDAGLLRLPEEQS